MDEELKQEAIGNIGRRERPCNTAEIPPPMRRIKPDELLDIAKRTDQFITDNGWSWCDMRQVYRILETIHG